MNVIFEWIGIPLGWIMWACYQLINNYGVALILFAFLMKVLMFPMAVKQQKSTAQMAAFKPLLDEINKKYKNNKEKQQQETMRLYEEFGYNPSSGCLTMFIQFPILFGLINVVYNPLTHIIRLSKDVIAQATTVAEGILGTTLTSNNAQISIINAFQQDPSKFNMFGDKTEAISNFSLNFLGLNLGEVPQFALNALILIPILSAVAMIASSLITQKLSGSGATMQGGMGMSSKIMMAVMIGISFFFCFSVPAGVGLYWIIQSLLTIVQAFIVNRFYNPEKMAEEARAQLEERKKKRKNKKVVVVEQTETGETVTVEKNVSQRELDKIRLAKARQMDAERYGDEADEVKDEDFD